MLQGGVTVVTIKDFMFVFGLFAGVYSFYIGWKMIVGPPVLFFPERLVVTFIKLVRGAEVAKRLESMYLEPHRIRTRGILNITAGSFILFFYLPMLATWIASLLK
jgi:hypothetical protein